MLIEKKIREKIKIKKLKIKNIFLKQNSNLIKIINIEDENILEFMDAKKFHLLNNYQKENLIMKLNQYFDKFIFLKNYEICYKIINFLLEIIYNLEFNNWENFIKNFLKSIFLFGIDSFNLSNLKIFFKNYKNLITNILERENILNDFLIEISNEDSLEIYEIIYFILKSSYLINNINYDIIFNFLNKNNYEFPFNFYLKIIKLLLKQNYLLEIFKFYQNKLNKITYLLNNFNNLNYNKDLLLFIILKLNKNLIFINFDYNILYCNIEIDYKMKILEIIIIQIKFKNDINLITNKKRFLDFLFNLNLLNMISCKKSFLILISIINIILSYLDNDYIYLISNKEIFFKKLFLIYKRNDNDLNMLLNDLNKIMILKNFHN